MNRDNALKKSVLDELAREPRVDAAHVGVTAEEGVVCLVGYVDDYGQKHAAEVAAGRVKGVKAVVQEIEVRSPFNHLWNDDEIAKRAVDRLAWHDVDPGYDVKIKVEKGWMTLSGQVAWHSRRKRRRPMYDTFLAWSVSTTRLQSSPNLVCRT